MEIGTIGLEIVSLPNTLYRISVPGERLGEHQRDFARSSLLLMTTNSPTGCCGGSAVFNNAKHAW